MKKHLMVAIFLLVIGCCAYSNSLGTGFMLDDNQYFDSTMQNLKFLPFHFLPGHGYYRPLNRAVYTVLYVAFGTKPAGYHLVNILYLWAMSLGLYFLVHRFVAPAAALWAAALFAVHPLNSSTVNFIGSGIYMAQTALMLASLWYMACIGRDGLKIPALLGAMLWALLAMLCHESAMALPLYAVVLFWVMRWPMVLTWPLWLVCGAYLMFRLLFTTIIQSVLSTSSIYSMDIWAYMTGFGKVTAWYLSRLVCPSGIVFVWGTEITHSAFWIMGLAMMVAGLVGLLMWARRTGEKAVALGTGWFLVSLVPALLGDITRPDVICLEPHWMIMALAGFCLCLGSVLSRLKYAWVFALLVLSLYVFMDRQYNALWSDEKEYCLYWMDEFPSFAPPRFYLADAYLKEHDLNMAKYYDGLAFNNPRERVGNINYDMTVGEIEIEQGHWLPAKALLEDAVRRDPQWAEAWTHLGVIAFIQGDLGTAENYFKRAITEDRFQILARLDLAGIYKRRGENSKAIELYGQILDMEPNHEAALIELIDIYMKSGDRSDILRIADKLLKSGNPRISQNARIILQMYGAP